MGWFLLVVAAIAGGALGANALLNMLGRSGGPVLTVGTFLVVGVGAVAAGFLFHIITLAWVGELPLANIVWPCVTWSLVSVSSLVVGAGRPVRFAVRALPFLLLGGITMFGAIVHPRTVFSAMALVLVGIVYGLAAPSGAGAAATQESARPKVRRGLAPRIGPYRLDMKTTEAPSRLVELTPVEKQALNLVIEFRNERIYHAPRADFAGASWDIVLGAVDDRVYKISALLILQNREQRDATWRSVDGLLRTSLGAPANATAAIVAWDAEDGNVVMNRAETGGAYALVLTLTSRTVSGFARIK